MKPSLTPRYRDSPSGAPSAKQKRTLDELLKTLPPEYLTGELPVAIKESGREPVCGTVIRNGDSDNQITAVLVRDAGGTGQLNPELIWITSGRMTGQFTMVERPIVGNTIKAIEKFSIYFKRDFQEKGDDPIPTIADMPYMLKDVSYCKKCKKRMTKDKFNKVIACDECDEAYMMDVRTGLAIVGEEDTARLPIEFRKEAYGNLVGENKVIVGITVLCRPPEHQALVVVENTRSRKRSLQFFSWDMRAPFKAAKPGLGSLDVFDIATLSKIGSTLGKLFGLIEQQ
jgi:uncharacterized CHY-type Zn-finger protein